MDSERRQFPRFNLLVDVGVAKRLDSQSEKLLLSKNISQGGVCVIAYEEYKIGDLVDVKINLPGISDAVKAIGKVVWIKEFSVGDGKNSKRFDVGLEFIGVNDVVFEKISKYLFTRQEKPTT